MNQRIASIKTVVTGCLFQLMLMGVVTGVDAATFKLPSAGQNVIGETVYITAKREDTFIDIAQAYGLGYDELVLANPTVDPWLPTQGERILLPTRYVLPDAPREGIVINLPEMRLYYYPKASDGDSAKVVTYPISIGRGEWETPLGGTTVTTKTTNPAWYPPESIRAEHAADGDPLPKVIPPGPDNPLGKFALRLGLPGYLIHGTNRPNGIGMRVTHGCVRLYPDDIAGLFDSVGVGTTVRIVRQPYKLGWHNDVLYLESHPPFSEQRQTRRDDLEPLIDALYEFRRSELDNQVDYRAALRFAREPLGIPIAVSSVN
ncbi:MAG: L,D-transpeptidase family protein [Gammaproteobacteria bacterium]|nr:L,D-transpeptidase family protein [Gammaproteobacteria bacterium]